MTYPELAQRLWSLAAALETHSSHLTGPAPAKAAAAVAKAAEKLNSFLTQSAQRNSGDNRRLADLLADHTDVLTNLRLIETAKRLHWKSPGAKTAIPAKVRAKFFDLAVAADAATAACERLESIIRLHATPKTDFADEAARRAELRRLGRLTPEALELELDIRFPEAELRQLARAAGLTVGTKESRTKLTPRVVHYARRHAENTALDAGA